MGKSWLLVALGLVACVACAGPPSSAAQQLAQSAGRSAPATVRGGFEPERRWGLLQRNDWEPIVAADPSSSWVYQMTTPQNPNALLFRASANGGATWNAPRHICRRGITLHFQYDPQAVVDAHGTVDVACLDNFLPGVVFSQSHDRGRTWSAPVRLDGRLAYSDKPILLVSPSGKNVYVAFNARFALYVAASHDGGATWRPAVRATARHLWYYPYGGTIAPNGAVWFAVDGEAGKNQTGDGSIGLVGSADGGANWQTVELARTYEGQPCKPKNCYPDFFTGQAAVAAGSDGTFVFVYARNAVAQGPNALYVRRSSDGVTWSDPFAIATAGSSTSPAIVAGPHPGDFRLVWQDSRNGRKAWNTWYARSTDDGATWSQNVRLSDRGDGAPYKHRNGYDWPFGDYLGLSVDAAGVNHVVWGEGAGVYVPGSTWYTRGN